MINFSAGLSWAQQRKSSAQNLRWKRRREAAVAAVGGERAACDLSAEQKNPVLKSQGLV